MAEHYRGVISSEKTRDARANGRRVSRFPPAAELALRLVLPRAALERLTARAIRGEGRKLEALIQEILETAAAR